MLKVFSLVIFFLLYSGCTPTKDNEPVDSNTTEVISNDILGDANSSDEEQNESIEAVEELNQLDYTPTCNDRNDFTFLLNTDQEPMMIYTPAAFDENTSHYRLVTVDQNDTVHNTPLNDDFIHVHGEWLLNGYINDENEVCLYTNYPLEQIPWDERTGLQREGQKNHCRNSEGTWYRYETTYYPQESGVWQYSDPSGDKGIVDFLAQDLSYSSFHSFNTNLLTQNVAAAFKITHMGIFPFYYEGNKEENAFLGINYLSNTEYNQENNITGSNYYCTFYSLTYESGEWNISTLNTSLPSELSTTGYALTSVLTPEGFLMFLENHSNHLSDDDNKSLFYVDKTVTGNVTLVPAEEKFGKLFVNLFWKQRLNYFSWIQKQAPQMAIDKLGRIHIHEIKTDSEDQAHNKKWYYYNVYDPASATPEEPVIRQYIGGCPLSE